MLPPESYHFKAILSADPSLGDDFAAVVVILLHHPLTNISFTRPGYEKWFTLTDHIAAQDILFREGKLYVATITGDVLVCYSDETKIGHGEMPTFTKVVEQRHDLSHLHYLARTPRGDLLIVCREKKKATMDAGSVKVYRVVEEEKKPSQRLQEVKDL